MSVNTQTPYVAYQPQPTKTQVNRSGFFIKYELKEEIGVGSTSKCYRCSRKSDGQNFACKVIDKRQVEVKFTGLLDQFFVEINVSFYELFLCHVSVHCRLISLPVVCCNLLTFPLQTILHHFACNRFLRH